MTAFQPRQRYKWLKRNIQRYLPVTHYMAISQARNEFAGTMGGVLWWIGEPLLYTLVYYFVFAVVFETKTENFISFLLLGLVVWRWFARSIKAAGISVVNNSSLMRQVDIPKVIFPIQATMVETYKFLFALAIICVLLFALGNLKFATIHYLPLVFTVALSVITGAGLLLSAIMPFVPDLKKIITLSFRALMLLSGVFFEASRIPGEYHFYFYLNPFATLIEGFRDVLFFGQVPDLTGQGIVFALGLSLCTLGLFFHWRYNRVFPRYLV